MDANTPLGREAIERGRHGLYNTGLPFVETPQGKPADVDGFFLNKLGTEIVACFEVKARDMTLSQLAGTFGGEWLVSADKIEKGREMARRLCVPFYGVLYLIPDDITMTVRIANDRGEVVADLRYEVTETQATVNGGKAKRNNAFISMAKAKQWRRE
jgi:hypothetical protein